ncbi:MAG: phosphoribosylformylglycinamidine synthase subunit PurS [Bdellovibrionales bacterium]|nr:phosphoribosylformylglycinamidine synthase subunit PurS [Bdellovibrionales bacterium]
MKIGVKVMPRNEVLDSQGRAVERTLRTHGKSLSNCRIGKYVELEIDEKDKEKAIAKAAEICEYVLYNPLIETYSLEVL